MDQEKTQQGVTGGSSAAADILSCRAAFSAYNISRVRELIRYLPPRKYRLFQQIPFWLHLNSPRVPGFIPDVRVPFGIYRFRDSGFWKQALLRLNQSGKKLRPFLSSHEHIQGLYLMGSSGTLAQTDASDFDYWVVIDREAMDPVQRRLLEQKLRAIETYCTDRYGQEVTFFVLDEGQVRANAFNVMNEESSGSAQRTLLKEEFYRTFIMIAGRIPYWAVLPPGLDDDQYSRRINSALTGRHLRFVPEDYIDLGNLAALDHDESLGAVLWQIYKARLSPAKSLIKAALIAHYFFSGEEGFLCDSIKTRVFQGSPGNFLVDPYALVFEKGLAFFGDLEDRDGLDLLKACIFLRLSDQKSFSAAPGESPREALLRQYLRQWVWDASKVHHMSQYRQWPETEKLRFDRAVFDKISFLYELILKGKVRAGVGIDMTDRDLKMLTHRIAGHYGQGPGKIPGCSSSAARHASALQFIVEGMPGETGGTVWVVYGQEGRQSVDREALFFHGPELLKVAAWLILNGFFRGKASAVTFQSGPECDTTGGQARRFVRSVYDFFKESLDGAAPTDQPPSWKGMMVCLHRSHGGRGEGLACADFLVINTWGEFFFDVLGLDSLETDAQVCYRIAEHLWIFAKDMPAFILPYRVVYSGSTGPGQVEKTVAWYFQQFVENALDRRALGILSENNRETGESNPLLLDRGPEGLAEK